MLFGCLEQLLKQPLKLFYCYLLVWVMQEVISLQFSAITI
jgi:hypothetical protein